MTPDQLGSLAQSLRDNEAFQATLDGQRTHALEQLATMDYGNPNAFHAAQAVVTVIDAIRGDIDTFVRSGTKKSPPGIA